MSESVGHIDPTILFEYEEGDLDGTERTRVERHLETCGVCRAELALATEANARPVGATLGARSSALTRSFSDLLESRLGGATDTDVPTRRARSRAPRSNPGWLTSGLLAASIAVLALGIYQMREPSGPTDLGQTMREGTPDAGISLSVQRSGPTAWQLDFELDDSLLDATVVVITSDGQLALERPLTGPRFSFSRTDLGEFATAEVLFVQIAAVDAVGSSVRSRPERLP